MVVGGGGDGGVSNGGGGRCHGGATVCRRWGWWVAGVCRASGVNVNDGGCDDVADDGGVDDA